MLKTLPKLKMLSPAEDAKKKTGHETSGGEIDLSTTNYVWLETETRSHHIKL
jgi:hypothetical protein